MNSFNGDELKDGLKHSIEKQKLVIKDDNPDVIKNRRNKLDFNIETCIKWALTGIISSLSVSFTIFVVTYLIYLWKPHVANDANIEKIEHIIYLVMQFMFISLISVFINKYLNRK